MAGKKDEVGRAIIREFCEKHPEIKGLTLAKMIYRGRNRKLFESLAAVRHRIAYHRGRRKGGSSARPVVVSKPVAATADRSQSNWAYSAPKSLSDKYEDYVVHGAQRILRLSDIHFPYHDEVALEAAINYGIKKDPTILMLDGDITDCADLSDHERDPRVRSIESEMKMVGEEIMKFKKLFPKARIIWKEGNHEVRLQRYIARKAPELYGFPMLDIPGLVTMMAGKSGIDEHGNKFYTPDPEAMRGVEWVDKKRTIRCGKLAFWHGHERKFGGKYPASRLLDIARESIICGHFHRTDEYTKPNLSGEVYGAWSTGCLCYMKPGWLPHNDWNHGFAYIDVEGDGTFTVHNHRVIDGRVR